MIFGDLAMRSHMMFLDFFLSIIDYYNKFTWVFLLKSKSKVGPALQNFHTWVKTQFGVNIKIIRSDNGKDFLMHDFYFKKGKMHQEAVWRHHNRMEESKGSTNKFSTLLGP